jgi:Holliday junction resolvasome RuvABC endonuclease subunit
MILLGIDPGVATGIAYIETHGEEEDFSRDKTYSYGLTVSVSGAVLVAEMLHQEILKHLHEGETAAVAIEAFVTGRGAGSKGKPADITRNLVNSMRDVFAGLPVFTYRATDYKPWATDKRLAAAGLLFEGDTSMRHCRDGARIALFAGVKSLGLPDPLR